MSREAVAALAALSLIIAAPSVAEACVPSSGGLRSFEVRVSVRAGRGSFCDLTLYEGASCAPDQVLGGTGVSCNTDSLVVTDDGTFIDILGPRIANRSWDIVHVFTVGDGARSVRLRLADLPATEALAGSIRVVAAPGGVLFRDRRREVMVPFETLTAARRSD